MSVMFLGAGSFFAPEFVSPGCVERGTVPWLLANYRDQLFPDEAFVAWRGGAAVGRPAWPASVLMSLCVLRWQEEGMSRRAACREANLNLQWKAAMGLAADVRGPDEKTVREFERYLGERDDASGVRRYLMVFENSVKMAVAHGVATGGDEVWATDSTPMWCYGAARGVINLLGDGLRLLAREWMKALPKGAKTGLPELAEKWELPVLLAKSTKGHFLIEWSDQGAHTEVLKSLVEGALHVVNIVRSGLTDVASRYRKRLLQACGRLMRVIDENVEEDENGDLQVAEKRIAERLLSITDPQAQHGRKSKSRKFKGFKLHVLGDVVSGLLLSIAVTPGHQHDGVPAGRLIRRAKDLRSDIQLVLADTAYGAARLRYVVQGVSAISLLAPPPKGRPRPDKMTKQDFILAEDHRSAFCPAGLASTGLSMVKSGSSGIDVRVPKLTWTESQCSGCELAEQCPMQGAKHGIKLHPYESEMRAARQAWQEPDVRSSYRVRAQCERLVNQMTRHGGRQARAWGLHSANLQAHIIALRNNLQLLAETLAKQDDPVPVLKKAA